MDYRNNILRDYQLDMNVRIFDAWKHHQSVMVQMPTGTGKTHLLASVIRRMLQMDGMGLTVWIIAHRRELVEQIEETVAKYDIRKEDGRVRALSIQWLSRHWEEMEEKPSLIVIDEAHHALAETYKELWIRYPEAKKLGMTATPCRLNGRGFTDLFEVLVASHGIAEFILEGWLSTFDYVSIRPDSEEQRQVDSLGKRGADGDYQTKEMNAVLNKRPNIERLYDSVRRYADGKKGIVYAISIDHARNIARYYTACGTRAAAIDSKTPMLERRRLVDDFKAGKIQVLVNVDVFSEGFDCPDVGFVQMARPTLSLAKYLQQVGRGLRTSADKATCILIDNVGLYRLFGLPTVHRDWEAMFEGRQAGKGSVNAVKAGCGCLLQPDKPFVIEQEYALEVVMRHEKLMEDLAAQGSGQAETMDDKPALKAFKHRASGLFGLKRGETITAKANYLEVFGTEGGMAVVRGRDGHVCIVDEAGTSVATLDCYQKVSLLKKGILWVTDADGNSFYIDRMNGKKYKERPTVTNFGKVEMLKIGKNCYSRTKKVCRVQMGMAGLVLTEGEFYLKICDYTSFDKHRRVNQEEVFIHYATLCLLEDDFEDYYHFCGALADGSIVVADRKGRYYQAAQGSPKRYIACDHPASADESFDVVVSRLKAEAEIRMAKIREDIYSRRVEERRKRLADLTGARPFQSGTKWGLKLGDRILIPPIYRNLREPVGKYCAFEDNPCQWGVIMLDGQVVVEPRYAGVEIEDNMARLTVIPGKVRTVKLHD